MYPLAEIWIVQLLSWIQRHFVLELDPSTVEAENARLHVQDHDLDRAKFVCDRLQRQVNTAFQTYLHDGAVQMGLIEDDGTPREDEQSTTHHHTS